MEAVQVQPWLGVHLARKKSVHVRLSVSCALHCMFFVQLLVVEN